MKTTKRIIGNVEINSKLSKEQRIIKEALEELKPRRVNFEEVFAKANEIRLRYGLKDGNSVANWKNRVARTLGNTLISAVKKNSIQSAKYNLESLFGVKLSNFERDGVRFEINPNINISPQIKGTNNLGEKVEEVTFVISRRNLIPLTEDIKVEDIVIPNEVENAVEEA